MNGSKRPMTAGEPLGGSLWPPYRSRATAWTGTRVTFIKNIAPHGGGPMRLKHALVVAALAATILAPARSARAEAHAWVITGLGGYSQFSDQLKYPADSLADASLFGGRFARGIGEYWILEVGGAFGNTHEMRRNGTDGSDVSIMN